MHGNRLAHQAGDSVLPVLDTTALHAAAVDFALQA
jgi:aspartate/glutamate racemase